MSVIGLKKQFNKASQYMNEKVLKAEHTIIDDDYRILEKKTDATAEVVKMMADKIQGVLQPNPAARVKIAYRTKVDKVSGKQAQHHYPHAETQLGDVMLKGGTDLGDDSNFGNALIATANALKEIADFRENLDISVNQNFVDPLNQLLGKELREISHYRKKVESRRLDYDGKKRKQVKGSNVTELEVTLAEEKFAESKELAEISMANLVHGDVEQICQLQALIEALSEFHRDSLRVLESLQGNLSEMIEELRARPQPVREHRFERRLTAKDISSPLAESTSPKSAAKSQATPSHPHCRALYDFEPENDGELGFKEGDIINLSERIDENWLEGELNGHTGYFPSSYVDIIVDV